MFNVDTGKSLESACRAWAYREELRKEREAREEAYRRASEQWDVYLEARAEGRA